MLDKLYHLIYMKKFEDGEPLGADFIQREKYTALHIKYNDYFIFSFQEYKEHNGLKQCGCKKLYTPNEAMQVIDNFINEL